MHCSNSRFELNDLKTPPTKTEKRPSISKTLSEFDLVARLQAVIKHLSDTRHAEPSCVIPGRKKIKPGSRHEAQRIVSSQALRRDAKLVSKIQIAPTTTKVLSSFTAQEDLSSSQDDFPPTNILRGSSKSTADEFVVISRWIRCDGHASDHGVECHGVARGLPVGLAHCVIVLMSIGGPLVRQDTESDGSSHQHASVSSNDASASGSQEDDASSSSGDSIDCGYLQSMEDSESHIIHLRMHPGEGEFQTSAVGYDKKCEIRVQEPQVCRYHCVITLELSTREDGSILRQVSDQERLIPSRAEARGASPRRYDSLWKPILVSVLETWVGLPLEPSSDGRAFYNPRAKVHDLILEKATTDLRAFLLRLRPQGQADLTTMAPVWIDQLTSGLEHMHSRGIAHRDIETQNVLVLVSD
ncbi:hypothetical protein FRC01_000542 [Tulasnella sp. 417]|nr:hypothetical protein FRC01_000542 [Tulasnella sp. 417]